MAKKKGSNGTGKVTDMLTCFVCGIRSPDVMRELHPMDGSVFHVCQDAIGCIERWKDRVRKVKEGGADKGL